MSTDDPVQPPKISRALDGRFLISCEDEGIEFVQSPPTCESGYKASARKERSPGLRSRADAMMSDRSGR